MARSLLRGVAGLLAILSSRVLAQDSFTFDINAGSDLQLQTDGKAAPSLTFSSEGGVPYTNPYDAQKIGSDGMPSVLFYLHSEYSLLCTYLGPLLLQDQHLIETLAHFVRERIPERCETLLSQRFYLVDRTTVLFMLREVGSPTMACTKCLPLTLVHS